MANNFSRHNNFYFIYVFKFGIDVMDIVNTIIKLLVVIFCIWFLITIFKPPTIKNMNISYDVKEVHLGTNSKGTFYDILYICDGQIKNLILQPGDLQMYKSAGPTKLVWKTRTIKGFGVIHDKFVLYVNDNMSFSGSQSNWNVATGHTIIHHRSVVF